MLRPVDFTVIGAGMVGMSTALHLKRARPDLSVRLLERSPLSSGGTTRNAGFACFGSAGEWLDDLDAIGPHALEALIRMRAEGLAELIGLLGAEAIGLQWTGGWELLSQSEEDARLHDKLTIELKTLQDLSGRSLNSALGGIHPLAGTGKGGERAAWLHWDEDQAKALGAAHAIHLPWEGMIHTGQMVSAFHRALDDAGVQRLHGVEVKALAPSPTGWMLDTSAGGLESRQAGLCTNGLAAHLVSGLEVRPVPNRVLVLRVAPGALPVGTYHIDRGYLYMRTLDEHHVLFGGGRHWGYELPLPPERNVEMEAQWDAALEQAARRWVNVEAVTHRWTGWLGVGPDRRPLIGESQPGLHHAVRMGGMGVAIGTRVGRELAESMLRT
ncbi:MAG: NAD(P)/FAD-dependent oxidoreductase [Flavobacteriales bacterium]